MVVTEYVASICYPSSIHSSSYTFHTTVQGGLAPALIGPPSLSEALRQMTAVHRPRPSENLAPAVGLQRAAHLLHAFFVLDRAPFGRSATVRVVAFKMEKNLLCFNP